MSQERIINSGPDNNGVMKPEREQPAGSAPAWPALESIIAKYGEGIDGVSETQARRMAGEPSKIPVEQTPVIV